jgi:hypothetical protein
MGSVGMRREPSLTFEGALQILGKHEHKSIEKIDKLLGGVILGSGVAAGSVALGVTPLAPLAVFAVAWGWAEQKGLAVELLKSASDAVSGRLSGMRGLERRELIAAAHSTIVVASVFESFQDHVGQKFYGQLKITDAEKISMISKISPQSQQALVGTLYTAEIPAPSATRGFEENIKYVARWQEEYAKNFQAFINGLVVAERTPIDWRAVRSGAIKRYWSYYVELAAKAPEFAIWAQHGEHAATRAAVDGLGTVVESGIGTLSADMDQLDSDVSGLGSKVAGLGDEVSGLRVDVAGLAAQVMAMNEEITIALSGPRDALGRVAALLAVGGPREGAVRDRIGTGAMHAELSGLHAVVSRANAGILGERIIPADPERYPPGLEIPKVSEIYINPRYRVAEFGEWARPADDRWWEEFESRGDFDVLLTAHVTSPDATRAPILLLGHPGAGKSLLTKVFAARLPASEYTVVRVPLRRVSSDARVHHQIEEALEISANQRIAWSELARQSEDTVRVVLLDGLDELLQASEHDRSSYLQDVMDFQEREAEQRRPVVVIVTSRTVVADRVRIPHGTTVVKLDPFNDDDIAEWLGRWNRVNADTIGSGVTGKLTVSAVRRWPELAEQPLLLLMLALYAADPELSPLGEDVATAELYRRLLDGFARREAAKDLGLGRDPRPDQVERRAQDHLDRLAIAALGMFNRGRQDISEEKLGKDLEALEPRLMKRSRPAEAGQRIIGEFFFVHAPETRTLAGHGAEDRPPSEASAEENRGHRQARGGQPQRAYEFLHATFGEYLVARRVIDELTDVAVKTFAGRRGPATPDDDLLFALLSHQVLASRKSLLDFAREIFSDLPDQVRPQVFETLEMLISTYRNRYGSDRYAAYQPVPPDQVRQLSYYSANLIALRVVLEPCSAGVPLASLLRVRVPSSALAAWSITPNLWRACLDLDGFRAMLTTVELSGEPPSLRASTERDLALIPFEVSLARLIGDLATERRLRYGTAIVDEVIYYEEGDSWMDMVASCLIPAIGGTHIPIQTLPAPPEGTAKDEISYVAKLIFRYLRTTPYRESDYKQVLDLLFALPSTTDLDRLALTGAALGHPELWRLVPKLQDLGVYGPYSDVMREYGESGLPRATQFYGLVNISEQTAKAITPVLAKPPSYIKGLAAQEDEWI